MVLSGVFDAFIINLAGLDDPCQKVGKYASNIITALYVYHPKTGYYYPVIRFPLEYQNPIGEQVNYLS